MPKFHTFVFDFDSTIVGVETLELLAELALEGNPRKAALLTEIRDITTQGMEGKITIAESKSRRMAMMSPTRDQVLAVGKKSIELISPSFLKHRDFFTQNQGRVLIVSSSYEEIIMPTADVLGIPREHVYANVFTYDDVGKVVGYDASRLIAQSLGKVKVLQHVSPPAPVVIVGDGWTDYEVRLHGAADSFVAYTEFSTRVPVVEKADFVASNFSELLRFLA